MANFTSAPIGSTAQSLDGLNVSTSGGPALFLEAVAIGDPTDGGALAPVNSTVGLYVNVASTVAQATNVSVVANQITSSIPFYVAQSSGPWSVQGTTNVQGTSSVNVLGTASTQIISSIPFYVAQSSAPWTVTATATIQGTSSAQIISSIPFFVAQSSAPWTVTATATVQGTSSVNVIGNITIQGTSSVNVLGAIPGTTQVNVVSSLALTIQGTSSVNVISSVVHTVTIQGTSSAQVLGGALNVSAAIFSAAAAAAAPANVVYMGGRTATTNPASVGNASTAAALMDNSGALIAPSQLRNMCSATTVTLTSTAAETTIIPATASEFHDITNLYVCNASSSAQTLTLREASAGTIRGVYDFNSTFANQININFNPPLAQTTSNANWTIQSVTNTLFHAKVFVAWVRKPT